MLQKYITIVVWVSSIKLREKGQENLEMFTPDDLIYVCTNIDQVRDIMFNPKKMYKGPAGFTLAATMVQKMYRYYRAYTNFKQLKFLMAKATFI